MEKTREKNNQQSLSNRTEGYPKRAHIRLHPLSTEDLRFRTPLMLITLQRVINLHHL